ncbi:MAG: DUF4261 domain-containing protein [Oscillospiraceae bacterium]|nr:DUF4261 domain-containing protein [Oscillospiraceae bacterium]
MDKKVLDQDTSKKAPEREMLIANLLFREKPAQAEVDAVKAALEKLVGEVGFVNDKPSEHFQMFSVPKYKAMLKDAPQGIPVLANFGMPREFDPKIIDELNRSQFWDYNNGSEAIDEFKYCVDVFGMFSAALHYKEQAQFLLEMIDAALQNYPSCDGIYVFASGKLTAPEDFEHSKQFDLAGRFIRLAVNARFFTINNSDDMIVDTLGFYAFGAADVQLHFHGMDPNHAVEYVYNIASYQFNNEFPVKSGETIDGIDGNGRIVQNIQWRAQHENSLIQPIRTVLDINCGKYAAGQRGNCK